METTRKPHGKLYFNNHSYSLEHTLRRQALLAKLLQGRAITCELSAAV